jgi:hypothetical protein
MTCLDQALEHVAPALVLPALLAPQPLLLLLVMYTAAPPFDSPFASSPCFA